MPHFEVIGEEDFDVEGEDDDVEGADIMGDVLGYAGPMGDYEGDASTAIVGYDEYGEPMVVGARRRRRRRRKTKRLVRVHKPGWRNSQLAPGVIAPDQGLLPLPLTGDVGNTFTQAIPNITFQGTVQKPFRGERLLVSTVRTGVSAVGLITGQLFVGTDLQQLDVQGFDIEQIGDPNAFGVRLTMKPVQPGVFIRLVCVLDPVLVDPDTILTRITILGRNLH